MKFTKGIPPKTEGKQYILDMSNWPTCVGMWNECEKSFLIANPQCVIHNSEPWDHYYEAEWVNEKNIMGWVELP